VYRVRYEFVTVGLGAYPGRTPRQTAKGEQMRTKTIEEKLPDPSIN